MKDEMLKQQMTAKGPLARLRAWIRGNKNGRDARISLNSRCVFVDLACYSVDGGMKHANAEGKTLEKAVDKAFKVWGVMYEGEGG